MRKRLLDPVLLLAPILILGALAAPFIHAQFGGIMNRAKDRIDQGKQKAKLWPDWRRHPPSRAAGDQFAALAGSGLLFCFMLFVALLCLEWFLRRLWGLV